MNYRVAYDVTQELPPLVFAMGGLFFVAIGAVLWRYRHRSERYAALAPWMRTAFAGGLLGFAVLWTTVVSVSIVSEYLSASHALRDGTALVVEGTVDDFHPMPAAGHDTERFVVKGVRFEYSDFIVTSGFNNTSSHGGPIRAGLPVRIHYLGENRPIILKLEIAQ